MVVCLASSLGLHWLCLQSVAWTSMVVKNLGRAPLATVLEQTFDGRHPCPLCLAVAAGRQAEKKSEPWPSVKKIDGVASRAVVVPLPDTVYPRALAGYSVRDRLRESPPLPPPRA